jgi:phage pi2 protein 07
MIGMTAANGGRVRPPYKTFARYAFRATRMGSGFPAF